MSETGLTEKELAELTVSVVVAAIQSGKLEPNAAHNFYSTIYNRIKNPFLPKAPSAQSEPPHA